MKRILRTLSIVIVAPALFISCPSWGDPSIDYTVLPELRVSAASARVLAFGDQGVNNDGQKTVAQGMIARQSEAPFDFAILLGDNFYPDGVRNATDWKFDNYFRKIYPASIFDFPFYAILGNHDHRGNPQAQYDYIDPDGRWTAPGVAYLLPIRLPDGYLVDIYFLDSEMLLDAAQEMDDPDEEERQIYEWTLASMRSRSPDFHILAIHRPFYSSGEHGDEPALIALFAEMFSEGHVDLVLSGHEHDMELQARDVDGDGSFERFVVAGSAARSRPVGRSPATVFATSDLGFAELDITSSGTVVSFRGAAGNLLFSD